MKSLFLLAALTFSFIAVAQLNQTNSNGNKDGKWEARYPNGKLYYEVTFSDGVPVGTEKRYDEKGNMKLMMHHFGDGKQSVLYFYDRKGKIKASGKYYDQQRDSLWCFYYADSSIMKKEWYKRGVQHGKVITYYMNGKVFEEKEFENGVQTGEFKQYFENGNLKLEVTVKDGEWDGTMKNYYPNGNIANIGLYRKGLKENKWVYYTMNGKVEKKVVYDGSEVICNTEKQVSYYPIPENERVDFSEDDMYSADYGGEPEPLPVAKVHTELYYDSLCVGHFTAYHPNEKIQRRGFYQDGKKDSIWTYYNPAGAKDSSVVYDAGVKNGEHLIFFPNGETQIKQYWRNNQLHGIKTIYSAKGEIIREDEYENGRIKQ